MSKFQEAQKAAQEKAIELAKANAPEQKEATQPPVEQPKTEPPVENNQSETQPQSPNWEELYGNGGFDYLSEQLGRTVSSFDDLNQIREIEKEVEITRYPTPELEAAAKFAQETGRTSLNDYLKSQENWSEKDGDVVAREYLRNQNPSLTNDDIDFLIQDEYKRKPLDPEEYSESEVATRNREIRKADIEFKKLVDEGRSFFENQKQKYLTPSEQLKQQQAQQEIVGKEAWQSGMNNAIDNLNEFTYDDFSYQLKDKEQYREAFGSLENLIGRYKTESGELDYSRLQQTLIRGEKHDDILSAYKKHVESSTIESQMRDKSNSAPERKNEAPDTMDTKYKDDVLKKMRGGSGRKYF
jgi:hypothetical protein